ncbi:hypothetical protein OHA72_41210 [Dactylosporangium sp. NBC_01737]|uniref:hypothetical protein n=1 Tax=Dactylosporangium sp. NBC_01737 TaxID=2975959 RepID=UPI002E0F1396|nr:hypothetical protein OHA72_41210 [Dactylosporangium sp. NBC_01737]
MSRTAAAPHPVRQAYRLIIAAITLISAETIAAAVLYARFDTARTAHAPWSVREQLQLDSMHTRLALTAVLGAGLVGLLTGVAMAVLRRSVGTRTVVGLAALLTAVGLLLGVVINPDNALLAYGAAEEAHLYRVLPFWFSVLSSTAVTGALFALAAAFVALGREAAYEYYQYRDPALGWTGFDSWREIARDR